MKHMNCSQRLLPFCSRFDTCILYVMLVVCDMKIKSFGSFVEWFVFCDFTKFGELKLLNLLKNFDMSPQKSIDRYT